MKMINWKSHISKKYNRKYWFNIETGESVWEKPKEVEAREKEDKEKKEREEKKRHEDWMREVERQTTIINEQVLKKKPSQSEQKKHEMLITNGCGMSYTIEGQSHWTKEDYMDELRNINQSLRDF